VNLHSVSQRITAYSDYIMSKCLTYTYFFVLTNASLASLKCVFPAFFSFSKSSSVHLIGEDRLPEDVCSHPRRLRYSSRFKPPAQSILQCTGCHGYAIFYSQLVTRNNLNFPNSKQQEAQLSLGWGRPYWLSRTLKVIQDRWFFVIWKDVCHFLLVINSK